MYFDKIKLEAVATCNNKDPYKYYKRNTILCSIFLGLGFFSIVGGSVSAALTRIWELFTLTGLGIIIIIISAILLSWHSSRLIEAIHLRQFVKKILTNNQHFIIDLAKEICSDQQGTLFILKHLIHNQLNDYKIICDVIIAKKEIFISVDEIKNISKTRPIGKINYHGLKLKCPHCKLESDFANVICPYCEKII